MHLHFNTDGKCLACTYRAKYVEVSVGINHNVDELLAGTLTQIRLKKEQNALQVGVYSFIQNHSFFDFVNATKPTSTSMYPNHTKFPNELLPDSRFHGMRRLKFYFSIAKTKL